MLLKGLAALILAGIGTRPDARARRGEGHGHASRTESLGALVERAEERASSSSWSRSCVAGRRPEAAQGAAGAGRGRAAGSGRTSPPRRSPPPPSTAGRG